MLYTTGVIFNMAITDVAEPLSDRVVIHVLNNHEGRSARAKIHLLEVTEEIDFDFQKKVVRSLPVTILPQHTHVETWSLEGLLAYEVQIEVDLPEVCPAVWGMAEGGLVPAHRFTTQELTRVPKLASRHQVEGDAQIHLFSTGPVENPHETSQDILISSTNYDPKRSVTVQVNVYALAGRKRLLGTHTAKVPPLATYLGAIELQQAARFEVQVSTDGPHAVVDLFGSGYVLREETSLSNVYSQQPIEVHRFTQKQLVAIKPRSRVIKKQTQLSQPTLFHSTPPKRTFT